MTDLCYPLRRTEYAGNLSPMRPTDHVHEFSMASFSPDCRRSGYTMERNDHIVLPTYVPKFLKVTTRKVAEWTRTIRDLSVGSHQDGQPANGGKAGLTSDASDAAMHQQVPHPKAGGTPRACPQCKSNQKKPYTPLSADHLVRCGECGLVYTGLEPSMQDLVAFYSRYLMMADVSPVTLLRYEEVLDSFEPYRKTGRILETGCGAGVFMQRAAMRGWQVHGTEIGTHALSAAQARGVSMIEGPLDPANYPPDHFDIVCSIEVIEHLCHPRTELGNVMAVLRPGGLFYVTTPNFNCLARRISPSDWNVASYPEHLCYFTPRTLHRMISAEGLQKRRLTTTGFSFYRWQVRQDRSTDNKHSAQLKEESIRRALEHKPHLRLTKRVANSLLNFLGLGDSMKAYYIKPEKAAGN